MPLLPSLSFNHRYFQTCSCAVSLAAACFLTGASNAQPIAPETAPPLAEIIPNNTAQPQGALTGASIFLSPGHGWHYKDGAWTTQRETYNGIIEDHSNAEFMMQYLVPYLWNAGARIYTTRERDFQTNMVIVDNESDGFHSVGDWRRAPIAGSYDDSQLEAPVSLGDPTSFAVFTPDIPEAGYYGVYVWYTPSVFGETTRGARFTINHTGGSTQWIQNENHDGYTWKYIGTYYFDQGTDEFRGSVSIDNSGGTLGQMVVADAMRFGGGMGDFAENGEVSGKPRWEESGMYYCQFMGFDPTTSDRKFNNVHAMPRYAEWEMEEWEKDTAIYLSWHSNGSENHDQSGLSTFVYGPNEWGSTREFTGFPGSLKLAETIHAELLRAVRKQWDSNWVDRGIIARWLGELNPRSNAKMPAVLIENGYHDSPTDAEAIVDPRFRQMSARAVLRGIVFYYGRYVNGFDNFAILPDPPINLQITQSDDGAIELSWLPPTYDMGERLYGDPATGYRVFRSANGKGFDNGVVTPEPSIRIEDLEPGVPAYFRVVATNAGGQSLPTETLAATLTGNRTPPTILIVNGYDRLDRGLNSIDADGAQRGILARMNAFDYVIPYAEALGARGESFDSCSNEAVIDGGVNLEDYKTVYWILGRESTCDLTFDEDEQLRVRDFLAGGGNLFVSGEDLAFDLDAREETAFLHETLRAQFAANTVESHTASGSPGSIFEDIDAVSFDDGTGPVYPVASPDGLEPTGGSQAALTYATGETAAIQYSGDYRLIVIGFPFETVLDAENRQKIIHAAQDFFDKP